MPVDDVLSMSEVGAAVHATPCRGVRLVRITCSLYSCNISANKNGHLTVGNSWECILHHRLLLYNNPRLRARRSPMLLPAQITRSLVYLILGAT